MGQTTIPMHHRSETCDHQWDYTPRDEPKQYVVCPVCRSTISVAKHRVDQEGDGDGE